MCVALIVRDREWGCRSAHATREYPPIVSPIYIVIVRGTTRIDNVKSSCNNTDTGRERKGQYQGAPVRRKALSREAPTEASQSSDDSSNGCRERPLRRSGSRWTRGTAQSPFPAPRDHAWRACGVSAACIFRMSVVGVSSKGQVQWLPVDQYD
jgi:hypothetical protein